MAVSDRLGTAPPTGNGDDGIVIAPSVADRDTDSALYDTGVNLADTKSALRPSASATLVTDDYEVRPDRVQVITLTSFGGTDSFVINYVLADGTRASTAAFVRQTNAAASDLQTALRTATGDSALTVSGTTDAGPYTITHSSAENTRQYPKYTVTGTGCTGAVTTGADRSVSQSVDGIIENVGESPYVSTSDTILKPTIGTITVTPGTNAVHSLAYSAGIDGGTFSLGYHAGIIPGVSSVVGGVTGGLAFDAYVSTVQAALDAIMGGDSPDVSIFSGAEVATIDLGDIGASDTFTLTYNAVKTAGTYANVVAGVATYDATSAQLADIQGMVDELLGGSGRATVARVDANTYTVTRLKSGAFASTFTVTDPTTFTPLGTGGYTAGGKITTAAGDLVWYFTFANGNLAGRPVPLNTLYLVDDALTDGGVAEASTLASVTTGVLGSISAAYTENGAGDSVLGAAVNDSTGNSYGGVVDAASPQVIGSIPPGSYHYILRTIEDGRVSKADSKAFTMTSA